MKRPNDTSGLSRLELGLETEVETHPAPAGDHDISSKKRKAYSGSILRLKDSPRVYLCSVAVEEKESL